jgi:hypothetical protein
MINLNDILTDSNVQNALYTVVTAIAALIYKKYRDYDKDRKLEKIGFDAWHIVEEMFRLHPEVKEQFDSKIVEWEKLVKSRFPSVTQSQLEWLNKSIAGMMNSDKSCEELKCVELPEVSISDTTETVIPVTKYYTPDGKELVLKEE